MNTTIKKSLTDIVGAQNLIFNPEDENEFLVDHRKYFRGKAAAIVFPQSTQQICEVVRFCRQQNLSIVPQGGNTSYGGGATPDQSGNQVLLNLKKLNKIRELDKINFTMTVEAGVILANAQQAADQAGMFFPLSLGAEASCQIGGNISTNAGGLNVLKYGNTRDLVLGLEVILPDGQILNDLSKLRKNNTGYNLTQLFCGAEGSLGIISAAVLKTFPRPLKRCCLMLAFVSIEKLYDFYRLSREQSSDCITSFEYISNQSVELVNSGPVEAEFPFQNSYKHYALVEFISSSEFLPLQEMVEQILDSAIQSEMVIDGTIAQSEKQRLAMWRIREAIPESERLEGGSIKHDISLPISRIDEFLSSIDARLDSITRQRRTSVYGHVGDGNLHFNLLHPRQADPIAFKAKYEKYLSECLYELTAELEGSFSAEHGIGQLKLEQLKCYKYPNTLNLMSRIKFVIDPDNTMNPGKLIPPNR